MFTLLLVEDNALIVELLTQILEDDYDVITAPNGQAGVELARRERPDLILMDLTMPVMDGWSAIKLIRAEWATCRIPIIALSAVSEPAEVKRALALGADGHVRKPIDEPALFAMIERMLGGRASQPSGVRVKREAVAEAIRRAADSEK